MKNTATYISITFFLNIALILFSKLNVNGLKDKNMVYFYKIVNI